MLTTDWRAGRVPGVIGAGALVAALLTGCSANPAAEHPAPPSAQSSSSPLPSPSASAPPAVPDVPIQGTELLPAAAVSAPVRIRIPDAGIDVAVEPVGVLDSGVMELPERVTVAGWYRFGADPSSLAGSTIVAAHVDSLKYGRGPFSLLKDVAVGAAITVTTADGAEHAYTLSTSEKIAKQEIPLESVFDRTGAPRLVLITCGGQFNRETGHYLDNILVTATPVDG